MSRTAIKKAEAFPGAFADPLDDGRTAKSQKLKNALAAARAVAGTPDALKTLPIVIVSLDTAGPPYPHADTKATEVDLLRQPAENGGALFRFSAPRHRQCGGRRDAECA